MPNRFIKESCRSSKNLDRLSDFEERLFWRLITTADDFGRFLADPELVRASCFPFKAMSTDRITTALHSLQTNDLIQLYIVDDRQYGYFMKWEKHQGKPRAKASKYPDSLADVSRCSHKHVVLNNHAQGPNTDTESDTNSKTNSESDLILINSLHSGEMFNLIVSLWNQIPGVIPSKAVTGPIKKRLLSRLNEHPDLVWWTTYFDRIRDSPFLTGRVKEFAATLDWVLGPRNMAKILNGNYDYRAPVIKESAIMEQARAFLGRG